MARKEELLETLRRSFDGEAWHGPAVRDVLHGVDARLALRSPPGGAHCIWELTLHIAAWSHEVARRIEGQKPSEPREGDWPMPAGEWEDTVLRVSAARDHVLASLGALSEDELSREVRNGFTVAGMVEGLAQHNCYHAGQIMMLRRILRGEDTKV